jgi:hypothetical protein
MSDRQRLTWQDGGDKAASKQPVLPVERAASAHPAYPDEGAAHPAHQPDPEAHDYENGDTSSWAEDPTTGPYPNSAHPATPDEGSAHPAHKQTEMGSSVGDDQMTNEDLGVSKAAAHELRAAVERKAAKCIRLATQLLEGISKDASTIEDQALDLMDIPDDALASTLNRLAELTNVASNAPQHGKEAGDDDEALLRRLLAEEEDEDEGDEEASKKADDRYSALEAKIADLEAKLSTGFGGGNVATGFGGGNVAEVEDDDSLLAQMLEEEGMTGEDETDDVEAMLQAMIDQEAMYMDEEPEAMEPEPEAMDMEMMDEDSEGMDIDLAPVDDPMGLMGDDAFDEGDEALLAQLFAEQKLASDDEDDDEDDDDSDDDDGDDDSDDDGEEESDKEEGKKAHSRTASRKPRPKKASQGATRLGGVTKEASSEIKDLEALWPSAPDVSDVFGQ